MVLNLHICCSQGNCKYVNLNWPCTCEINTLQASADEIKMAKVTIDGIEKEVPDGTTILQAARMIGPEVTPPAMCYYTNLKTSGGYCRTCLVEVTKGSEKDPRPNA
jgi:hypothetical protein